MKWKITVIPLHNCLLDWNASSLANVLVLLTMFTHLWISQNTDLVDNPDIKKGIIDIALIIHI